MRSPNHTSPTTKGYPISPLTREEGAIFVEVALFFPLFVAVFLGFVFFATGTNSYLSLEHSVGFVRYAFTRGDIDRVGKDDVISAVKDWRGGDSTALDPLLIHNVPSGEMSAYDDMAEDVFGQGCDGTLTLADLPDSHIYSLIYVSQVMRQSIGDADVQYPCAPDGNGPNDGAGCLKCSLMHASSASTEYQNVDGPSFCDANYNQNWVGVSCEYRFGLGVLEPIVRIVGYMSNSNPDDRMVVQAQRFFESTS